jgi:hypothetical protein
MGAGSVEVTAQIEFIITPNPRQIDLSAVQRPTEKMSKANSGKGKGVSEPAAQKSGNNDQAAKKGNAKPANVGEARGQSQPQQQGQRAGGRGGNDQKGAAAKQPDYLSKYPRLELEKENKQLDDFTAKIDAAYSELVRISIRSVVSQRCLCTLRLYICCSLNGL